MGLSAVFLWYFRWDCSCNLHDIFSLKISLIERVNYRGGESGGGREWQNTRIGELKCIENKQANQAELARGRLVLLIT